MVPDLFIGQVGELLKKNQMMHMIIRINHIKCSIVTDIDFHFRNF
jgi:hypothetical protein